MMDGPKTFGNDATRYVLTPPKSLPYPWMINWAHASMVWGMHFYEVTQLTSRYR